MPFRSKVDRHYVTRREGNEHVPAAEARGITPNTPQSQRGQETMKKFQATVQRLNEAIQKQDTTHPSFQFLVADFDAIPDVANMAQKLETSIAEFQEERDARKENQSHMGKMRDKAKSLLQSSYPYISGALSLASNTAAVRILYTPRFVANMF